MTTHEQLQNQADSLKLETIEELFEYVLTCEKFKQYKEVFKLLNEMPTAGRERLITYLENNYTVKDDEVQSVIKKALEFYQYNAKVMDKPKFTSTEYEAELLQMVYDLKKCIERLTSDDLELHQEDKDKEAQWIGEAHELLHKINPDYYNNANK